MVSWHKIQLLRLQRQFLMDKADKEGYNAFFRDISPVSCQYWSEPGSPPSLPGHARFDDSAYNDIRRFGREIIKGRFAGGNIGYIAREDLELYACLFRKPIKQLSNTQMLLLSILEQEGPLNIGALKRMTGMLVKEMTPALHKLQAAFLVYEDQVDMGGDRGWYLFDREFPNVNLTRFSPQEALERVIPRFAKRSLLFDEEMLRSYYKLPVKLIAAAIASLLDKGRIQKVEEQELYGYVLTEDKTLLQSKSTLKAPPVVMLQRNDFLVKSQMHLLEGRFQSQWGTLYYLLIDGEIQGAVTGRFTFGPHEVEDIVLELPEVEAVQRQEEILAAVEAVFPQEISPVHRYNGKDLL